MLCSNKLNGSALKARFPLNLRLDESEPQKSLTEFFGAESEETLSGGFATHRASK